MLRPSRSSSSASASACGMLRGKPSSRKPSPASSEVTRSMIMAIVSSSGTRSPFSMYLSASLPSSLPFSTSARNMSPVAM